MNLRLAGARLPYAEAYEAQNITYVIPSGHRRSGRTPSPLWVSAEQRPHTDRKRGSRQVRQPWRASRRSWRYSLGISTTIECLNSWRLPKRLDWANDRIVPQDEQASYEQPS